MVTWERVQRHRDALRRSVQQEHDLADQFILRWQIRKLLNLRDGNHAALDHSGLELKRRDILGNLGERFGQCDSVSRGVASRLRSDQVLYQFLANTSRPPSLPAPIL